MHYWITAPWSPHFLGIFLYSDFYSLTSRSKRPPPQTKTPKHNPQKEPNTLPKRKDIAYEQINISPDFFLLSRGTCMGYAAHENEIALCPLDAMGPCAFGPGLL